MFFRKSIPSYLYRHDFTRSCVFHENSAATRANSSSVWDVIILLWDRPRQNIHRISFWSCALPTEERGEGGLICGFILIYLYHKITINLLTCFQCVNSLLGGYLELRYNISVYSYIAKIIFVGRNDLLMLKLLMVNLQDTVLKESEGGLDVVLSCNNM